VTPLRQRMLQGTDVPRAIGEDMNGRLWIRLQAKPLSHILSEHWWHHRARAENQRH
jgi:hypothetical protein